MLRNLLLCLVIDMSIFSYC